MIIIDRLIEKKEQRIFREELEANGFALKNIDYHNSVLMKSRVFLCLIRGILIFMACFGTAGAAVSAFGLAFNVPLVVTATLLISFFVAFIYYNKITFYLGYIVFFIIFAVSIFSFYFYVNSGFQAFINTLNQEYSSYFYLNSAREANEIISDRYLTVSVAMIFLSGFLALLLNITISGYMNLPETFLLTFPVVQTGLYIEKKPGLIYLIMLLSVYICVAVLGRSGHYMTPDISGKRKPFKTIKKNTKKGNIHTHTYVSDGISMITTGIWSFVFCIGFILLTSGIFYANFDARHESNLLKNTTDEYIKSFVQNGIYSFFDRYSSKGGLSRGRLGGVSSVRPDYETDLVVTYAPVNTDNIYLKAYIGTTYTHNLFDTDISTQVYDYNFNIIHSDMFSMPDHNPYLGGLTAAMDIENIDADNTYDYMPYYAESSTGRKLNDDGNNFLSVYYEPYSITSEYTTANPPSEDYANFVYDTYLNVPDFLYESLDDVLDEADIDNYASLLTSAEDDETKRAYTLACAAELKKYFFMNFQYTMAPGVTPYNADFIEYFLSSERRGYCAHFASSSALLLRRLGIPTRYVEGYMISFSNVLEANAIEGSPYDWMNEGLTPVFDNIGALQIDVTDGSAHAWTEIYLDGFGWIPYDFTPPSTENQVITDYTLGGLFQGLFITGYNNENGDDADAGDAGGGNAFSDFRFSISGSFGFLIIPAFVVFILVTTFILVNELMPVWVKKFKITVAEGKNDYNTALSLRFILFQKKFLRRIKSREPLTPSEVKEFVAGNVNVTGIITDEDLYVMARTTGQAIFGNEAIEKSDYVRAYKAMDGVIKAMKRKS